MKCLIIGNGGREHALAWKISLSPHVKELFIARGNGGTQKIARSIDIAPSDIESLLAFARDKKIDLTVVGPEAPIVAGITDRFRENGLLIFGPSKKAAQLEGSKIFAKELMKQYGLPTSSYAVFDDSEKAFSHLKEINYPVVIKVDGLAEGKGVCVCKNIEEAKKFVNVCLMQKRFGTSQKIIMEDFLRGEEASYICITDGETVIPLAGTQDHKTVYDDDQGPNTGGMGAVSPTPAISQNTEKQILNEIIYPVLNGLRKNSIKYAGFLYAGLMLTENGPMVLEFNIRGGDPETQPLMIRLKSDLFEIMFKCSRGELKGSVLEWDNRSACCVIMASKGYPEPYEKGKEISGIEEAERDMSVKVFHAGTILSPDKKLLTNGGRVLGVTALGHTMNDAVIRSYEAVRKIKFDGAHYRNDIGRKALT